jgi:DNA-binding FadR family transcriptional regulator
VLWGLKPVEAQATHGLAVDRLRGQIHAGLLLPDEKLPAERQLAEDFGISRVTLRDALRVLENDRYTVTRRGALGGAFVAAQPVLQDMAIKRIARDPAGAMRVLEFRCANEAAAIGLATLRRSPPEIKRMRAALDAMASGPSTVAKQAASLFLLAVGDAAHNPLLASALRQGLEQAFEPFPVPASGTETWRAVHAAIEAGDEAAATLATERLHAAAWTTLRQHIRSGG